MSAESDAVGDRWLDWLLRGRDAGDREARFRSLGFLAPIFERVLEGGDPRPGDVVLEVGAGEGRLGLMGLAAAGPTGRLLLTDISQAVVEHLQAELLPELANKVEILASPAESLDGVADDSVDVVLVRSVLIYASDLRAVFASFARVLRPGGRLSVFEPLWGFFDQVTAPGEYFGRDLSEVADEVQLVVQGFGSGPGVASGFAVSAPKLVAAAEMAGFGAVDAAVDVKSAPMIPGDDAAVNVALHGRPNPNAPSAAEIAAEVLSPQQSAAFLASLERSVRSGTGRSRTAGIYLSAVR